jgi:EAL domain-containing protein (putative c-di-GMP-specific phosphodiesterase class I)
MIASELREADRLESLWSYGILDTGAERAFDLLCEAAATVCGAPMAMINLVDADRQWAKARVGAVPQEVGRDVSLCNTIVETGLPFVVPDVRTERCLAGHPSASGARFVAYAGVPLIGRDGLPIGALCVLDVLPRAFVDREIDLLRGLADQVMVQLELRRHYRRVGYVEEHLHPDACRPERLRAALDNGELVPHYQPVVDMVSGEVLGLEALLRWNHPAEGLLAPSSFLPALTDSGLLAPVTRMVLDHALSTRSALAQVMPIASEFRMGVNIAPAQLSDPGFHELVIDTLRLHQTAGCGLLIELTEDERLGDLDLAKRQLRALGDAGVMVFLDDFGAGWSNLQRTLELPLTGLKIDGSLIGASDRDERARGLVRGALGIADELGLMSVAEGVETDAMRDRLLAMGCRYGQGWLFGRPTAAENLGEVLSVPTAAH